MSKIKKEPKALVLRCCRADMTSKNGFIWPGVGGVAVAEDWKDNKECGSGLHGWLYGHGNHHTTDYWDEADAKWLVVEVFLADVRMIYGKCKFSTCKVVFVGDKQAATDYLLCNEPNAAGGPVIGASRRVGDFLSITVGALGSVVAGDSGTATAGDGGEIRVRWYDSKSDRYRTVVGYVGEYGIEPNVAYRLNDKCQLVKANPSTSLEVPA